MMHLIMHSMLMKIHLLATGILFHQNFPSVLGTQEIIWTSASVTFEPFIVSMETDYHQASLGSLVCDENGEAMSSQTPGPVIFQPGSPGGGPDSFPCLRPLSFPQRTNVEAHCSGDVTIMVKEKTENGNKFLPQYYLSLYFRRIWRRLNCYEFFCLSQ